MCNSQIDSLDNEINELQSDLNGGRIPGGELFEAKEELNVLQERFDDIVRSKPVYSHSEENYLHQELEKMTSDMRDTLYSRYDQHKGKGSIARPQQEADLNDKPCINISPEVARVCNIGTDKIVNGKVSRNMIDKARKILCAYFGRDDASREAIRPENQNGRGKNTINFSNFAFEKRAKEIYGDNYRTHEQVFGTKNKPDSPLNQVGGEATTPAQIQLKIDRLKAQIEEMAKGEVDPNAVKTVTEVPVRETKADATFVCDEEGCGFVGRKLQKPAHVRKHNKMKADAAKLLEEE